MPRGVRDPSEVFRAVLDEAAKRLKQSFESAGAFEHRGIKGDERASALASFLENHLPADCGVAKGEALDFSDARTGQLDLLIYDRAASAPILVGNENLIVPCESLYMVIEVKSILTQNDLDTAYRSALKVRSLRPFKKRFVGPRVDGAPADDDGLRCMYCVFAFRSNLGPDDWLGTEYARVTKAAQNANAPDDVVERVIVLERGMINPCDATGKSSDVDDRTVFLEFYLHIVNFINRERGRRPPVDWQIYTARRSRGWRPLR